MIQPIDEKEPSSERQQTDESLRVEREKADVVLEERAVDETADAVIDRARARADQVLAATRARTDRRGANLRPSATVVRERVQEDQAVEKERTRADERLRAERADDVAVLSIERQETDKDLLQERSRSDDALAARDEFLGIVSHDLKNMLGSVVGFASLIAMTVAKEERLEEVHSYAKRIQRSGARMNRLIGDLVDVASIEAGVLAVSREVGDPTAVVTEAVDTFKARAAEGGVSLDVELPATPTLVALDPARILQVLSNLLSNAIKFTKPSGKVVVHVERIEAELRFAVSDTGEGIPKEMLEPIFERFVQVTRNDRRGLGLGLYISKCIVQGHGGRIWAESKVGEGSTFCFTIPIS